MGDGNVLRSETTEPQFVEFSLFVHLKKNRTMKQLFVYIAIAIICLACTDQQVTVSEPVDLGKEQLPQVEIRRSLSDVPINGTAFCTPLFTRKCAFEVVKLQRQLMALDPVPVPQLNVDLPIPPTEADQLYHQFVTKHAGQPVLALFRQLYPRIMLNKYGIIISTNYSLVTYYTCELIESGSYDFVTQAKALKSIRAHVPVGQFNQLTQKATINARLYKPQLKQDFDQNMAYLNNLEVDLRLFPEDARKRIRAHFVDDNQATNQAIAQIEQWQSGVVTQIRP